MGNQNVLLKGINDDINILRKLYMKLAAIKVRPYYMYQCDLTQGLSHFRVDVRRGIELMEQLTGYISGYAVPKYVIDAPGGGGKIPVNSPYIKEFDGSQVVLRNYKGDIYTFPENLDL